MQQWQSTLQALIEWWQTPMGGQLLQLEKLVIRQNLPDSFGHQLALLAPENFTELISENGMHNCIRLDPFAISRQSLPEHIDVFIVPQLLAYCDNPYAWLSAFWQSLAANGTLIITGLNFISYLGLQRLLGKGDLRQLPLRHNSQYYLQALLATTHFIITSKQRFALPGNEKLDQDMQPSYFGVLYCLIASKQLVTVKGFRRDWRSKLKFAQQRLVNPYNIESHSNES